MSKKVYASWGTDRVYRWLWRAALQDAIFAFKNRMDRAHKRGLYNDDQNNEGDLVDNS